MKLPTLGPFVCIYRDHLPSREEIVQAEKDDVILAVFVSRKFKAPIDLVLWLEWTRKFVPWSVGNYVSIHYCNGLLREYLDKYMEQLSKDFYKQEQRYDVPAGLNRGRELNERKS